MCNKSRLMWIMAAVGAGVPGFALAAGPGNDDAKTTSPTAVHNVVGRPIDRAMLVDDPEALELANKLGLNTLPEGLRGVPGCDIINDINNCHIGDITLAANFSNAGATAFRTMDNVTPLNSNPTQICWIGRYANRLAPAVANESFQIRIFNDMGGFPDLLSGPVFDRTFSQLGTAGNNQLVLDCLDGQSCPGTTNPAAGGHFVYSATVTGGFPMAGNGCYWVEITCVGSAGAGRNWGWLGSTQGTDNTSLQAVNGQYTLFTRAVNDRALCLSGGVNPFLGNCTIAQQPPICENDAANGYGFDGNFATNLGLFASWPGSAAATGSGWGVFQGAENFALGTAQQVSSICFQGFWAGYQNGNQVAVTVPTDPAFRVAYLTNSGATGVPGAGVPIAEFQLGQPGVSLQWDGDGDINIIHPPVNIPANSCTWVSIGRVQIQNSAATPVPIFHWYLTTSTNPGADARVALRTAGAAPGAWQAFPNIDGASNADNLNILLNAGPVTNVTCNTAPACQITIPGGVIQENEANCGGGVVGGDTTNGGCNSPTFVTRTITCGQTIRGTTAWNGNIRDTDWYSLTLTQPQDVTITVNAEFAGTAGFIGNAGGPLPSGFDCMAPDLQINPAIALGNCTPATVTRTLPAGTWTIFVGGPLAGDQILCANNTGSEYTLNVSCAPASGPPANDECANAIALNTPCTGNDVTVSGTTNNAAVDGQLACGAATVQTAGGVWYTVVGNGSPITASACSTVGGYDGQISVYTGQCGNTVCVGGDDDGCGTVGGMSTVTWNSTAGTTYRILMHGFDVDFGNFNLVLSSTASCGGGCTADWNNDGTVNSNDISAFLTAWLNSIQQPNLIADFNGDMVVNSNDISAFLTAWLAQIGPC